jgi:transglutaminase-like putative cysteine protease
VRDEAGDRFLALEASGVAGRTLLVTTTFDLERQEVRAPVDPERTRPMTDQERRERAGDLTGSRHVVVSPEIRDQARAVVGTEQNPLRQARALYDWTLGHMQYWVKSPATLAASGVGSSAWGFEKCTGNCTDFHSLWMASALAVGLPTRMVYGSFLKGPLDGLDRDQSYHCWIEFWAPELGWIPLDVAVADLYVDDFQVDEANAEQVSLTLAAGYPGPDPSMVDYYFGNLDARRVTWHRGRDLVLPDGPRAGPLNALPKAWVEVDGAALPENQGWTRKLTFRQLGSGR